MSILELRKVFSDAYAVSSKVSADRLDRQLPDFANFAAVSVE